MKNTIGNKRKKNAGFGKILWNTNTRTQKIFFFNVAIFRAFSMHISYKGTAEEYINELFIELVVNCRIMRILKSLVSYRGNSYS